jgi:flagellar hook assembly protein FlgD
VATIRFFNLKTEKEAKMNVKRFVIIMLTAAALVVQAGGWAASSLNMETRTVTNYPNPFDSRVESTTILYTTQAESDVVVMIYDLFGNPVREYRSGREGCGTSRLVWDGTNEAGEKVAKGGYVCVVRFVSEAAQIIATRKIGVIH